MRATDEGAPKFADLADRIRSEANVADRPGQMDRLNGMADEVARLKRACEDLGHSLAIWMNLAVEVTGSQDCIEDDGDGDWGAVAERMSELAAAPDFPFLVQNNDGHPIARFTTRENAERYSRQYLGLEPPVRQSRTWSGEAGER